MRNVKIVTDETYLMIIVSDFFIFKFNLEYKRKLSVKNELKFTDRLISKNNFNKIMMKRQVL